MDGQQLFQATLAELMRTKISYAIGDVLQASADALVNTVNCVGVMGRGVALQFKMRFPDNFKAYKQKCDRGEMRLGEAWADVRKRIEIALRDLKDVDITVFELGDGPEDFRPNWSQAAPETIRPARPDVVR